MFLERPVNQAKEARTREDGTALAPSSGVIELMYLV